MQGRKSEAWSRRRPGFLVKDDKDVQDRKILLSAPVIKTDQENALTLLKLIKWVRVYHAFPSFHLNNYVNSDFMYESFLVLRWTDIIILGWFTGCPDLPPESRLHHSGCRIVLLTCLRGKRTLARTLYSRV